MPINAPVLFPFFSVPFLLFGDVIGCEVTSVISRHDSVSPILSHGNRLASFSDQEASKIASRASNSRFVVVLASKKLVTRGDVGREMGFDFLLETPTSSAGYTPGWERFYELGVVNRSSLSSRD